MSYESGTPDEFQNAASFEQRLLVRILITQERIAEALESIATALEGKEKD